MSNLIKKVK